MRDSNAAQGYAGAEVAPTRQPQVEGELQRLENVIDALGKEIGMLANRLASVSSAETPSPIGEDGITAVQTYCPVAENLRVANVRIGKLCERINRMRDLLEI